MTEPTIKAALEAAEQGFYTPFIASLCDQVLVGKPFMRVTQETHRQCLAAAIAAFLRALPDVNLPFDDGSGATWISDYQFRMLADHVERAAREGGG